MAKKRKAAAPIQEAAQKPKLIPDHDSSSSEEEEEDEEEVEEEELEEESDADSDSEEEEEDEDEDEDEEELNKETLKKLLEPFVKDQIIEFLKEAALKNPSILARITESAESDPVNRKIFVHGLGWDATSEQVISVFKQHGDIEECKVVTDKVTGRSKGYGFVLFKTRRGAHKALKQPQKKVGNRMTSCQLASAGPVPNQPVVVPGPGGPNPTGRKIYVSSVGPHINPDKLRSFFAKFGEIEEGPFGHDPATGKLKGYALFVYKTAEGCKKALEEPVKLFEGTQLQCRRAVDGHRANKNQTASIHRADISTVNYGMGVGVGVNPGILGHNVNPAAAAVMVGQNPGIGLANPVLASAFGQTVLPPSAATGFPSSIGATPSLGFGGNYGINNISPSVIGSYSSQAALQGNYVPQAALHQAQGIGAYQNAQLGQSSAGSTPVATARPQSAFGSAGTTFHPYFGR